jgi:hypothetical protein
MALRTLKFDYDQGLSPSLMQQFGFQPQESLKAIFGKMGVLLMKESASITDILLALEEIKNIYQKEIQELDQEWDDFTLAEEWQTSEIE